ncbi:MAG: hypothetical protein WC451_03165 [Patescibacteria group bacterium]|jgi:hypothetical protein
MSDMINSNLTKVPDGNKCGSVRVTIASNVGQGNGGTELPCKMVWMVAASANTGDVRFRVGAVCTAITGEPMPKFGTNNYRIWLPIDDVSKLYFYGSVDADVVDITFTR